MNIRKLFSLALALLTALTLLAGPAYAEEQKDAAGIADGLVFYGIPGNDGTAFRVTRSDAGGYVLFLPSGAEAERVPFSFPFPDGSYITFDCGAERQTYDCDSAADMASLLNGSGPAELDITLRNGAGVILDSLTVTAAASSSVDSVFFTSDDPEGHGRPWTAASKSNFSSGSLLMLDGNGAVTHRYGNEGFPDFLKKWDEEYYFDYDQDKAKELLAESGYNGEEIVLLTSNNTTWSKIAEVIMGCLRDVGINCKLNTVDDAMFVPTRNSYSGWDVTIDNKASGDYVTSTFKYSFDQDAFGGMTQCGYTDEDMQVLLRAALEEETHNAETADAFHQYLKSIAISRGLYYDYYNYVANVNVKDNPLSDKCFIIFGHAQYDPALFK